jgi:adenine-specific DNA methylase
MSEKSSQKEEQARKAVAIESKLPLNAIDIESQKDMESGRYHPLRGLHKWFAARPTPAARLAIIASSYPGEIDSDELLKLMQIAPGRKSGISDYVERKFGEKRSSGSVDDHYGYPNPNKQSPTAAQLESFHQKLRDMWDGELPTVLDPTAGRGIIPFEAMRYGLPVKANELNPVPTLIMKVGLEYAPKVGSVSNHISKDRIEKSGVLDEDAKGKTEIGYWRDKIQQTAKEQIEEYYPTEEPDREILNSAFTYIINCESCGGEIPLVMKWWLNKTSAGGDAIKPRYSNGTVEYEYVKVEDAPEGYDPNDGPVSRGDAECPHCGVVTKSDDIRQKIRENKFEYSIYGVNYQTASGENKFRAGSDIDAKGMQRAAERVETDFEMMDFLAEPIQGGLNQDQIKRMGMEQWRDIFTPRQLVVTYEYLEAFREFKSDIQKEHTDEKAETILTLLTFAATRTVQDNTRLVPWFDNRGFGNDMFRDNNFALKKMAGENNLSAPRKGYLHTMNRIIEKYEELVEASDGGGDVEVFSGDAASLTNKIERESIDVSVVDPPYYSSIMYAELSDIFYVVQKAYLRDIFPSLFDTKLTDKESEAVANPSLFNGIASDEQSQKELADDYYEEKMEDIFSEQYNLLSPNGVMTVMFTHREMDAWDTLTSALISAGFTITATHPIKTEMSDRIGLQGKASADSSILLVARKQTTQSSDRTLWEDVHEEIHQAARKQAEEILDSGYNISKTDTAIAAYGPTLRKYAEAFPVVNKKGEEIRPREALSQAREAVTGVLAERFLNTEGLEQLDPLTRWYILSWLIYENDTIPYDEANQLGVAANVDIDNIKSSTKIWGKSKKDIVLKDHNDRVQDIVLLKNDSADNPSSRKYPVNPTDMRFTYTIDTVHAAIHVYEREGARAAWEWLSDRNLKSNQEFEATVTALLEVLPSESEMHKILVNLVSGETGDYLDIDLGHIDISGRDRQTELGDHRE